MRITHRSILVRILLAACIGAFALSIEASKSEEVAGRLIEYDLANQDSAIHLEIRELEKTPLYQRVGYLPPLIEQLKSKEVGEWMEGPGEGKHDLTIVAGRAATMLEAVFGFEIEPIRLESSTDQLSGAQQLATLQANAFLHGIRQAREAAGLDVGAVERLREKYQAKLLAEKPPEEDRGGVLGTSAALPLQQLLNEWYPIGKRFGDLERIVGIEADHAPHGYAEVNAKHDLEAYSVWHGVVGIRYVFRLDEAGIIQDVYVEPGM